MEIGPLAGVEQRLSVPHSAETRELMGVGREFKGKSETLWLPDLPGVTVFFFKGGKLDLPAGFRTVWKTRPLEP